MALFANIANLRRPLELTRIDMLIMSYGGLRGALAFALALILNEGLTPRKKEFITAATVVVMFTVFVQVNHIQHCQLIILSAFASPPQGTTLGPLVKLLNVRRKQIEEPTMSATLTNRVRCVQSLWRHLSRSPLDDGSCHDMSGRHRRYLRYEFPS